MNREEGYLNGGAHASAAASEGPDAVQVLDDRHLAVWGRSTTAREMFTSGLLVRLRSLPDTQVCVIHGELVQDLYSFCVQLERALANSWLGRHRRTLSEPVSVKRRLDAPGGPADVLRRHWTPRGAKPPKRRVLVWRDADRLLRQGRELFGVLADMAIGVSAECEFTIDDRLLLQRFVFVGDAGIGAYAEDENGQFHTWRRDGADAPFWRVVTGVEKPPVAVWALDDNGEPSPTR